jgi:hypothetical protein
VSSGHAQPPRVWSMAERRTLAWLVVFAIVLDAAAISPLVNGAAESSAFVHYTQHGFVYRASALLGGGARDLYRAWPLATRCVLALGALSVVGDIGSLLPPFDDAIESNEALHEAQHGIVFLLAGAALGIALRDIIVQRRHLRS